MTDVLVTGASGFLGAHVMQALARAGRDAAGLVNAHEMPVPGRAIRVDLGDPRAVMEAVRDIRPRAVIHCAAVTAPDACEAEPDTARAVNVTATGALAMAAFALGAHFTFVSTDLVFDGRRGIYAEEDPPSPLGEYARTKAQAEHLVRAASPDFAVVRPSFIYGEPMAAHHASFSNAVFRALSEGREMKVFTDQYRSPIPANALAMALLEISDRRLSGIWHAAGPDRVSRSEFARTLARVSGLDPSPLVDVSMDDIPLPSPRPRDASLDTRKAREGLHTPLPGVEDGLRALYGR